MKGAGSRPVRRDAVMDGDDPHRLDDGAGVATPLVCGMPQPIQRGAASRWMGSRFGEVSTTSTTARPPNCCTHSTSKPAWAWHGVRGCVIVDVASRHPPLHAGAPHCGLS